MNFNTINLPRSLTTENQGDVLKVLAFAEGFTSNYNEMLGKDTHIVEVAYIPEGVAIKPVGSPTLSEADFQFVIARQDAKSVNLVPLSKATYEQGMIINESQYGSSTETFFLNSFSISIGGQMFRAGISNFTQTLDNNPFEALNSTQILYYSL